MKVVWVQSPLACWHPEQAPETPSASPWAPTAMRACTDDSFSVPLCADATPPSTAPRFFHFLDCDPPSWPRASFK